MNLSVCIGWWRTEPTLVPPCAIFQVYIIYSMQKRQGSFVKMYTHLAKYQIRAVVFVEIASRRARRLTNFLWVCYNFPVLRHEAGHRG